MATVGYHWAAVAMLVVVAAASTMLVHAEEHRCDAADLQFAGTYLCYNSSGIARFDDGDVTNDDATDYLRPLNSGPDKGAWWWVRLFPAPARDPYSFEGETGTFTNEEGSLSNDAKVYPIDGSFDDDIHCVLTYSMNQDWWEAECLTSSGYVTLELGDGSCDVDLIAAAISTFPDSPGIPDSVISGICERTDDDFLGDGIERVAEPGDVNGLDQEDEDCDEDFSLVHQLGVSVADMVVTDYVTEDNCAQTCAPNFSLGELAQTDIVPGSCADEGYDEYVTQTAIEMGGMTVFVDVYEVADD